MPGPLLLLVQLKNLLLFQNLQPNSPEHILIEFSQRIKPLKSITTKRSYILYILFLRLDSV